MMLVRHYTISALLLALPAYVFSASNEIDINTLFEMDLEQLVNLEVSIASKTPESILKTAGTVYVVTEEDIQRYGWRDLREILAFVPSYSAARNFDWFQVSLRGGGANMVKLLIDGREVQNLIADEAVIQDSFPAHRIKRVEVLMGSHSTLYGSNAADGVINVVTKHGLEGDDKQNSMQVMRGDVDTSQVSVLMKNSFEDGHLGVSVSTFESNYNWPEFIAFTQNNDLWSRKDTLDIPDYSSPVAAPYRSYSFGLSAQVSNVYFGANVWEDSGPQGYNEVFSYWGERRSIRKFDQWFIGNNFKAAGITGSIEYIFTDEEDLFLEPDWNGSLEPVRHQIKSEASTRIGKHNLVFGYDGYTQKTVFRNDALGDGGTGVIHLFPQTEVYRVESSKHSLFIHDSYDFYDDKMHGVFGLRYENYKDVDDALIPRAGLVYTTDSESSFRFIYGGGFRAPNGFDIKRADNNNISSLPPIKSQMFEFGYTQSLAGQNWLILNNFSIYSYKIEGNYITSLIPDPNGGPGNTVIDLDESSKMKGLENMLKFEYENLSGFLSARYSDPDETLVAGESIVKDVPTFKAKLGLSYLLSRKVTASLFVDHWSDVDTEANIVDDPNTEVHNISAWTRLDLNLVFGQYDWGDNKLKLSLNGENITDETYTVARRGPSPYQILQPPRTFRFTLDVNF